jgi:hypothetical protein
VAIGVEEARHDRDAAGGSVRQTVTTPRPETVAALGFADDHSTLVVRSSVEPSAKRPVARSGKVSPRRRVSCTGVTSIAFKSLTRCCTGSETAPSKRASPGYTAMIGWVPSLRSFTSIRAVSPTSEP